MVLNKAVSGKILAKWPLKALPCRVRERSIWTECQKSLPVFMNLLMMGVFDTGFRMEVRVMKVNPSRTVFL